jgi:hypothetical protein
MPPSKKKINVNTVANTEAKPIDSFFASPLINNELLEDNNNYANTDKQLETNAMTNAMTNTMTNIIVQEAKKEEKKEVITKENVFKNLIQHKILFSHIEIKNKIDNLSENEVTEIFKIIKNNNEKYSTNKNGIFFNLSTLRKNTIQEISNFLYFCDNNNKEIEEEEHERAKYKEIINDT